MPSLTRAVLGWRRRDARSRSISTGGPGGRVSTYDVRLNLDQVRTLARSCSSLVGGDANSCMAMSHL